MSEIKVKQKILIVDDVPGNIKTLAVFLRGDYATIVATNGQKALEAVASQNVNLILLDVEMPGMNGFEVLERLKSNPSTAGIPVIFVSGEGDKSAQDKGLEMGAVAYLTKPVNPSVLKELVKNHC
jgi:CheY-like chemotaxis protein